MLDRLEAACVGWSTSLAETDLRLLLPSKDALFEAGTCTAKDNPIWWPSNLEEEDEDLLGGFAWLCRTVWLGGRIQSETYKASGELSAALLQLLFRCSIETALISVCVSPRQSCRGTVLCEHVWIVVGGCEYRPGYGSTARDHSSSNGSTYHGRECSEQARLASSALPPRHSLVSLDSSSTHLPSHH